MFMILYIVLSVTKQNLSKWIIFIKHVSFPPFFMRQYSCLKLFFLQCLNSPHFFITSGGEKRVNYSVNSSRNRPSQSVLLSTPINRAPQCLLPPPPPLLSGYSYTQFPKFSPKILLFSHNVLSRDKAEWINGRRVLKLSSAIWCRKIEAFIF